MHKRTKIVCTLGPSCETVEIIESFVKAGMNVARLNFSHGTHENHAELLKNVRTVEKRTGEPVAVMQDLQGPRIRLGVLPDGGIEIKTGGMVSFDTAIVGTKGGVIPIDVPTFHEYMKPGDRILLNDGRVEVKVVRVNGARIDTEVVVGGLLSSHKSINAPDSTIDLKSLSDKDKEDLRFGVVHEVDLVAVSFVRGPEDIADVKFLISEYEKEAGLKLWAKINVIAKIERREAVERIEEILDEADGIMVARGDLGMEIPMADVPIVQKRLIDIALSKSKPVIVATQMLDSMQNNPRPTRAEVSDVANAVIDHTDAVMLSNETAAGKYPLETVETMAKIAERTEASMYDDLHLHDVRMNKEDGDEVMGELAKLLTERIDVKMILSASLSGETGRMISKFRPELPIYVSTHSERVLRQLNLSWGVRPFILPECKSIEELVDRSLIYLKKNRAVKKGDKVVVVAGEPVGEAGNVNLIEMREVK